MNLAAKTHGYVKSTAWTWSDQVHALVEGQYAALVIQQTDFLKPKVHGDEGEGASRPRADSIGEYDMRHDAAQV